MSPCDQSWCAFVAHFYNRRPEHARHQTARAAADVEVTRRAIAGLHGPVILVGHSYGGVVITEAGNDPRVVGLVYIAAFAPDAGESVLSLLQSPPPGDLAAVMADSHVPWGLEALGGAVTQPGWRTKPSWYLVATDDRMIPADTQRAMAKRARATVVEIDGSPPSTCRRRRRSRH